MGGERGLQVLEHGQALTALQSLANLDTNPLLETLNLCNIGRELFSNDEGSCTPSQMGNLLRPICGCRPRASARRMRLPSLASLAQAVEEIEA